MKRSVETYWELETVLLVRNFTLNFDVAPNNRHMFGPETSTVPHLWKFTVKHIITNTVMKQEKRSMVILRVSQNTIMTTIA